jgi:hypothetical protein
MAYQVRARQRNAPHRRELWANASARRGGPSSFSDLILLFVLSPQEHDLAKVGVEGSNPFARSSDFFNEINRMRRISSHE